MDNLCCTWWGLLLFALLSGFLGWLLRDWLLRSRKEKYEEEIRRRDAQILNTSTLLNQEINQKDEHINKMIAEINLLQSGNRDLKNEITALQLISPQESASEPLPPLQTEEEFVGATHDLVEADDDILEVVSSGEEGQESVDVFEVGAPLEVQVEDAMLDDIIKLKSKLKRRKSQIKKLKKEITELATENKSLQSQVKNASDPIIKEIEVREEIDQKKLLKLLSKLPIKKSKKVIDTSVSKGKPKIIKKK